ncbi:MAG: hypothetical protein JO011_08720, partial [Ktedonobacteraceae bacterium]|nr:hypothetical protein [Ktedonobacteraceae bacterium]
MAGSNQKKAAKRQDQQQARVAPNKEQGSSRVSNAAGSFASGVQSVQVEQRSNAASVKQSGRRSSSSKQSSRGKQGGRKGGNAPSSSRRPGSPSAP